MCVTTAQPPLPTPRETLSGDRIFPAQHCHASHPATTPDRFAAYNEATSWEPRYVGLISNDDDGGVPACRALISTSGTGVCGEIMSMSMYISRYKGGDLCPDLGTNTSFSSP